MSEINTFAFFDLETTGLPDYEYNKTKITEISIVACRKERLLAAKNGEIPRVHHKLTLCFNPCKMICLEATKISALDNDILEHERKFDSNTVDLIFNFIKQLQGPVCLVAHNGTKCDFPILKKQILDCDKEIPSNILVIDSLHVFRELDKLEEEEKEKLLSTNKPDIIISNNEESDIVDAGTDGTKIDMQKLNETTPKSIKRPSKNSIGCRSTVTSEEVTPQQSMSGRKRPKPLARKELFPATSSTTPIKYFSLINIHQRMFGEVPPISHYAEADTISLIKCATEKNEKFVQICEATAKLFCDVKPLSAIW